ncbi:MAG TPA: Spy/CpxP family protein refolding chaperone [Verrucomicrobiae bacterium]|nr:Spy/CpxP family protein refolding chaperone [Verrucomicrobiae bacterium]
MLVRVMLAALMAAGLVSAQPGGMGQGGGMGEGMGGGSRGGGMGENMGSMPMQRRQTRLEMFVDKLKLKSDQKSEVERILSASAEKAGPVRDQLNEARKAVANAILSKASDDDVKKVLADYATVSAQMTGIEADAFGKIYALLKPNQQAKAAQAFELLAGVFIGGGGGAGRGRGNRGGGE